MPKKIKSKCTLLDLRRDGAAIIARAEVAGERIVITSWGKPRAALVSLADLALIEAAKRPSILMVDEYWNGVDRKKLGKDLDGLRKKAGRGSSKKTT